MIIAWNQCHAHARDYNEETGLERVVTCSLEAHEAPYENAKHYDEGLDIFWQYADNETRFDDDEPEST